MATVVTPIRACGHGALAAINTAAELAELVSTPCAACQLAQAARDTGADLDLLFEAPPEPEPPPAKSAPEAPAKRGRRA